MRGKSFHRIFGSGAPRKVFDAVQGCYCKKKLIIYLSLGTSVNYIICHVRADEPPQIINVILMTMYELNLLRWTVVLLK